MHLVMFLVLSFFSPATSIDCKWLGSSPFCGHHDCPSGWVELARTKSGGSRIADFGEGCMGSWFGGEKTLCCKKEAIKKDVKQHCTTRYEKQCANGTERAFEATGSNYKGMYFTCCTPGTFA